MKFYYNGKLVRTSKTHEYKYALINTETEKARACSKDLKGVHAELAYLRKGLDVYLAVQNGTYRQKDRGCYTAKQIEENAIRWYGSLQAAIDNEKAFLAKYKIVELEARA